VCDRERDRECDREKCVRRRERGGETCEGTGRRAGRHDAGLPADECHCAVEGSYAAAVGAGAGFARGSMTPNCAACGSGGGVQRAALFSDAVWMRGREDGQERLDVCGEERPLRARRREEVGMEHGDKGVVSLAVPGHVVRTEVTVFDELVPEGPEFL